MRNFLAATALALAGLAGSPAAAQTPAEQRQLDWATARGRLIFALDRVAWVATDDLKNRVPDLAAAGIRGYVVDREANGFVPIFYGEEDGKLVAIYRARVAGAKGVSDAVVFPRGQRPALTPQQVRLVRALELVRKGPVGRCGSASPNLAVIPPEEPGGPIDVYVTAPQMRPGAVQFGGHERISIGADGKEIARRPFTRSCLEVPVPPQEVRQRGGMLGVNHLLDGVPNEVHVFLSMALRMPLVVITRSPDRTWQVTGERIALMQQGAPTPK